MEEILTAIALDDHKAALDDLERVLLTEVPEIRLLRKCTHKRQLKAFIAANGPVDLFFCDVQLGRDSGLKVAEDVMDDVSLLLFFTDYSPKYKDAAMELGADACLQKPVDAGEVKKRVKKLRKIRKHGGILHDLERKLYIKDPGKDHAQCILVKNIVAITTDTGKNRLRVVTAAETHISRDSLTQLMVKLKADHLFVRIGKGTYVALDAINALEKNGLYLNNGYFFPVGRFYRAMLVKRMKGDG